MARPMQKIVWNATMRPSAVPGSMVVNSHCPSASMRAPGISTGRGPWRSKTRPKIGPTAIWMSPPGSSIMPMVMVLRPLPFCRKIGRMTTVPSSVPMAIMIMATLSVNVRFAKGCRFSSSRPMRVRWTCRVMNSASAARPITRLTSGTVGLSRTLPNVEIA